MDTDGSHDVTLGMDQEGSTVKDEWCVQVTILLTQEFLLHKAP